MVECPGCGAAFEPMGLPASERHHASGECLAAYHELNLRTLALGDPTVVHHAVDAYVASHASGPSRPVTVWFALAGLCLALEKGLNGRQVQLAHVRMARGDKSWPIFTPPAVLAPFDTRNAQVDDLRPWMAEVWALWATEHRRTRILVEAIPLR